MYYSRNNLLIENLGKLGKNTWLVFCFVSYFAKKKLVLLKGTLSQYS